MSAKKLTSAQWNEIDVLNTRAKRAIEDAIVAEKEAKRLRSVAKDCRTLIAKIRRGE